jgi:2'-5' RNA ligase
MANEISVWLVPLGDVCDRLAHLILELSQEYASPLFPPHVTLLGGLSGAEQDIIARARQLAAQIEPFQAQLGSVDYLDNYHRALFVRVKESEPLLAANRTARDVYNCHNEPRYMPHLSLLYGHFAPSVKGDIIAKIGNRFDMGFQVTRIELHSTFGDTRDWYSLGKFELGRAGEQKA